MSSQNLSKGVLAMFKDTKEELDRLQQELLQEQATQVFTPEQDPR